MNRQRIASAPVTLVTLLVAACASSPPAPESMRDPNANFAAYQTYAFPPAPAAGEADPPLLLLDQNIRGAIAAEMQQRGYREAAENPDLRIDYETASAEKIESSPVRVGIGVGSWGGSGGGSVGVGSSSVRNYREGTLVIHAIDTSRNAEVWQGRISTRISKGGVDKAAVSTAVAAAMKDFPARSPQ